MHREKITPRYFIDPLGVIKDAPICNAGVFSDLTECSDAKYIIFVLSSFSFRRFWVIHSQISTIQCSKFFKEEEKFNSLSGSSDIYSCLSSAYKWYLTHIAAQWSQEDGYTLWKPEDQELNPVVHQITKTECQIKYHEHRHSLGALFQIGSKPFKYFTWQPKHVF